MTNQEDQIARVLSEQRQCASYLLSAAPDKAGARAGLADWVMEEAILRSKNSPN